MSNVTFLSPESPEWERAWSELAKHPVHAGFKGDRIGAECPATGEVWEYMGTEVHPCGAVDIITTADGGVRVDGYPGRWVYAESGRYHTFRHRSHPCLPWNGGPTGRYNLRAYVRIPANIGTAD